MTTLAVMKARIANELGQRTDLDAEIAYAINDAIAAYQAENFHFNQGRSITFNTVNGQAFYGEADEAALARVWTIHYAMLFIGNQPYTLAHLDPANAEASSSNGTSTGQPSYYTWYGDQIRLYPVPDGAWTVRLGCTASVPAPATDGEASNPWMTHAERLIRSRAKLELALHVLHEETTAIAMGEAVKEAFRQLKDKTTKRTGAPGGKVKAMEF